MSAKSLQNNYSCYDLKQSSKVNLSVYFLPARRPGESYKNQTFFKRNSHSKNFWSCLKIIEFSLPPCESAGKSALRLIK
ncbi:MAG: hypothetical protein LBR79_04390 [Oscillospiraceae bacterium]|nr:hypothetical protein [Oscillospiraceae bacterium]